MNFENSHSSSESKETNKNHRKNLEGEAFEGDLDDKRNDSREIDDFLRLDLSSKAEFTCSESSKRLNSFSEVENDRKKIKFYTENSTRNVCSETKSYLLENTPPVDENTSDFLVDRNVGVYSDDLLKHFLVEYALSNMSDDKIQNSALYSAIRMEANRFGRAIQRVCHFFLDALLARTIGNGLTRFRDPPAGKPQELESAMNEFFNTIPNMTYCVKSVNEIFIHALGQQRKVHIIKLGMTQNNQISQLMQGLASSNKGLSHFRYTIITNSDLFNKEYEMKLAMLATRLGIEFDFHCMNIPLENLTVAMLNLREEEAVAVCCCMELRYTMDESVFRFNQRDAVIRVIKEINARVFCLVEMNADFNGLFYLKRFKECLEYYYAVFEYHDAVFSRDSLSRLLIEKQVMGRIIMNVVACEGSNRRIRAESLEMWEKRMAKCGFSPFPIPYLLNSDLRAFLEHFPNGFSSKEVGNTVGLRWKDKGILFISAWQ